jgi:hypothetical protein
MVTQEQLHHLMIKWTVESDSVREEARRLEVSDLSRHATSIAMLEARAQAIERCNLQVRILNSV